MYEKILIALENSKYDQALLDHVLQLASLTHSELLLVHVSDGWVARNYERLQLAESEEMIQDRTYLQNLANKLNNQGFKTTWVLALGNPPDEILKTAEAHGCTLIAMGSHGHRFFQDILFGSTISKVRHLTKLPVLLVKTKTK